jgi:hypothetical protein
MDDQVRGDGQHEPEQSLPEGQILVVPAHPRREGDAVTGLAIETRLLAGGERVAMAFTSTDKLVAALGEYQPWVAVPAGKIKDLLANTGLIVLLDPVVDAQALRWTAADLATAKAGGEVAF